LVRDNVKCGSEVFTDAHSGYRGLNPDYLHEVVDHAIAYVRGRIHVNSLENFWCLVKRALMGTYVAVDPVHLNAYLAEACFRFNARKGTDASRFSQVMRRVLGKRLTYAQLTRTI
ncbi:MAG: transposase, partial [Planctomycetes bacterium]|nr:transposase [Planctomycetota bacterium]